MSVLNADNAFYALGWIKSELNLNRDGLVSDKVALDEIRRMIEKFEVARDKGIHIESGLKK